MINRQIARVLFGFSAAAALFGSIACATSPSGPTPVPAAGLPWPAVTGNVGVTALAQCLAGSGDASCFSATRLRKADISAPTSAPILNNNQPVQNSGSTVTLSWTPPFIGVPTSYVIEASSTPGGPANLANFNTGNASTTFVAPGVGPGTYYVRIRAIDATGLGARSNEVQLIVGGGGGAVCPSAPRGLTIVSQSGGTVTLGWQAPSTGAPTSYVVQAGSSPNAANLANFDTNSTDLTLEARGVAAGSYYVRVYGRSSSCDAPTLLTPASNEILLSVGSASASGWTGQIVCRVAITGPSSYRHDETQTWTITGPGQTVGPRTTYPVQWTAQGSGGAIGKSWTINSTATADLSATIRASDGITLFDRTTTGIIVRGGIVGTPTSFDLYEIDFPTIVAGSANATSVSSSYTRATVGGDSPQQPGGSVGTLSCNWSLNFR